VIAFHERRSAWPFLIAAVLGMLLVVLAVLQYRWLGDVSAAERERMRATLTTRATDFTQAFDAELTRIFVAFQVDPIDFDRDPAAALSNAYSRWQSAAAAPALVKAIYVVDPGEHGGEVIRRVDPARAAIEPSDWPPELRDWIARLKKIDPALPVVPSPLLLADAVDATIPALIVALPNVHPSRTSDGQLMVVAGTSTLVRTIVLELDEMTLRQQVLQPLVTKYFGADQSDFVVTIVHRDDPSRVVFASDPAKKIDQRSADVTMGLFDLRMDEISRVNGPARTGRPVTQNKFAITIVRRANGADGRHLFMSGDKQGGWQMFARYRSDSLDAIVSSSRRRNFAIVLAVLGLLAASVVLIIASADRQRRLAQQQMEFVASVSHELRTPLAVICSAGENLADGLVHDADQIKRYGAMVQTEGRRLTDMIERVMRFAGIASSARTRADRPVDVAAAVRDAVAAASVDAHERGVIVSVHGDALPAIGGDADALRSAFQNVVGNAVKYSPPGSSVDVTATAPNGRVQIRVVDRGLGIDPADLPHVFKPFYRGRRAVDAQIRGSGIGLSVVRTIVSEHHGDVRIESRPGVGTEVTIELPVLKA
jgi:signal transduction histidine kinase